jgi:pyrimidine-specific ribonucleoside hydrolase
MCFSDEIIDVVWDMETGDPDDVFTLCFLASHPRVRLKAVTVTPGSPDQIGLVKHILDRLDIDVPVGSRAPGYEKKCVSGWYYKWLGKVGEAEPDGKACDVMYDVFRTTDATLITGGPVSNAAIMLNKYQDIKIPRWVGQGGFAGDQVVPKEYRLEKFDGMDACPTYNFNGDPKAALLLLESDRVLDRMLVSKNVCHGVQYDKTVHEFVAKHKDKTKGLSLMYDGMDFYLSKRSHKKFHDPLAAAAAIDSSVCKFVEVELFRRKGKWGSVISKNTNTFISISVDFDKFLNVLTK